MHLQEKIKPVTPQLSEVRFYADDELLKDLEKLKGFLAHSHPGMTTAQLVSYLTKLGLKKHDPFALGGKTTLSNLRLLCSQHNLYEAERIFGRRSS